MENTQQLHDVLRKAVEKTCGFTPHVLHQFSELSSTIAASINKNVSDTTLRRFWGYQETEKNIRASRYTLDTLAIYAGYKSWDDFCECQNHQTESNSALIYNEYFHASDLEIGTVVRLTWKPNRQMWVKYLGENMWTIVKSVNGKLSEGYTFYCSTFIKHLPLELTKVSKDSSKNMIYRCGIDGGIDYHIEQ